MSSFIRRIQRQLSPSQAVHPIRNKDGAIVRYNQSAPRKKFLGGRGQKLGVTNPKDPCRTGKRKAIKRFRAAKFAVPKPQFRFVDSPRTSAAERREKHINKMAWKQQRRSKSTLAPYQPKPELNRHTGKPHEHKREIARRLRQQARQQAKAG